MIPEITIDSVMFFLIRHELKIITTYGVLNKDFTGPFALALSCKRITAKNTLDGDVNDQKTAIKGSNILLDRQMHILKRQQQKSESQFASS